MTSDAPSATAEPAATAGLLAAYVGPVNADYYRRRFAGFLDGGGRLGWNWPAFFVTSLWLMYRKMWLWTFVYSIVPLVLGVGLFDLVLTGSAAADTASTVVNVGYYLFVFVVVPACANWLYFHHARAKVEKVQNALSDPEQQAEKLRRIGGVNRIAPALSVAALLLLVLLLGAVLPELLSGQYPLF